MSKTKHSKRIAYVKNEVGFWLGVISSIIALAEYFIDLPLWFRILWFLFLLAFIIRTVFLVAKFFINDFSLSKQLKIKHSKYLINLGEELHKCLHQIKDYVCYEEDIASNKTFCSVCQNICNDIEKVFSELWDDKNVSVCMKRITTNTKNKSIEEWNIKTVARSSNSKQARKDLDNNNYRIMDNKDFYVIASPKFKDSVFASPNMEKICEDFKNQYQIEYSNSTLNYLDYYKSTIVVPIRISFENANKFIKEKYKNQEITYNIIGFLCIDSLEKYDNNTDKFLVGINVARALADSLYKLFENNYVYTIKALEETSDETVA